MKRKPYEAEALTKALVVVSLRGHRRWSLARARCQGAQNEFCATGGVIHLGYGSKYIGN
jgi:hypothetical protein